MVGCTGRIFDFVNFTSERKSCLHYIYTVVVPVPVLDTPSGLCSRCRVLLRRAQVGVDTTLRLDTF